MSDPTTAPAPHLPYSLESERAILGGILLDPAALDDAACLSPGDFYRDGHRLVFEAMRAVRAADGTPDAVSVHDALKARGVAERCGGLEFLLSLAECPSAANTDYYARIVRDYARLRRFAGEAGTLAAEALRPCVAADFLDAAERRIHAATERDATEGGPTPIVEAGPDVLKAISDARDGKRSPGLSTGMLSLDRRIVGLAPGQLVLLAARPRTCKSALAWGIALDVAAQGHVVAYFSLEMLRAELVRRHIARETGISVQDQERGSVTEGEFDRAGEAVASLAGRPLHVDDSRGSGSGDVAARARRVARRAGSLALVVVDYTQLLVERGRDNREQEVAQSARALKDLAGELKCPVVAVSQINRTVEDGERPMLGSLRESGELENAADTVLFLWRPKGALDRVTMTIAKQRNGPEAEFDLGWEGPATRVSDLERWEPAVPANGRLPYADT